MKTKILRFEQKVFDENEIDEKINSAIEDLEEEGFSVEDVKISVGRDSSDSAMEVKYALTVLILYE